MTRTALRWLAFLLVAILATACGAPEAEAPAAPAEPAANPTPAPADTTGEGEVGDIALTVTTVDGEALVDGRGDAGQQARVGGTVSSDSATICVLVRPPVLDEWFVQPPPTVERSPTASLAWPLTVMASRPTGPASSTP